jgi:hypothetical protein
LSLVFLARHAAPALYYLGLNDISALAIFRSARFIHLNSEVLVFRYEGTNVKILSDASMFNSNNDDILLSGRQRQIGTAENQREIVQQLERSSENPRTYVDHVYSDISPWYTVHSLNDYSPNDQSLNDQSPTDQSPNDQSPNYQAPNDHSLNDQSSENLNCNQSSNATNSRTTIL